MAEGVGFEPTVPFGTTVFKTVTIDRSDTPPKVKLTDTELIIPTSDYFRNRLNSKTTGLAAS